MRYARKKQTILIEACRLGDGTALERKLLASGKLKDLGGGRYEVFSQEARDGKGELAQAGEYVKLDASGCPYPNSREFFESSAVQVGDSLYRQISKPVAVWLLGDPACDFITFLLDTGRMQIVPESESQCFRAVLWGAPLSAPRDAAIVAYSVARDAEGQVTDVDFNFVVRDEFERLYEWCETPADA